MQSSAGIVEEYVAGLSGQRAELIEQVRSLVLDNLPDGVEETMNFGMISYEVPLERYADTHNHQPLMYAALASQKNHCSLYLHAVHASADVEQALRDAYAVAETKLDMGKSCVRFKRHDQLVPAALGAAIGAVNVEQFIERYEAGRA